MKRINNQMICVLMKYLTRIFLHNALLSGGERGKLNIKYK